MTPADVLGDPVRLRAVADLGLGVLVGEDRFDRVTRTVVRVLDVPAGVTGDLPPGGQELARIAVANADRLARLVDEICDLERLSAGQVVLERRPHRLRDLVAGAVADVSAQAGQAGVAVRPSVDDATAWRDGARVRQAVQHLLENAVRASSPGTSVEVRARSTRDVLLLEVEDRGCGIDPHDLERVFGSFTRGDSSDTRAHGGTGLGLALARSVAEAHGGRLTARSTVGEGTTFTLTLPQRAPRQGAA